MFTRLLDHEVDHSSIRRLQVLLVVAVMGLLPRLSVQAQTIGPADLFTWPDDTFTLEIHATSVANLFGFGAKLNYDDTFFDYVSGSLEAGSFLGTTGMLTFDRQIDGGLIDFAVSRTDETDVSGSGVVATFTFAFDPTAVFDPATAAPQFFLTELVAVNNVGGNLGISEASAATLTVGGVWPGDLNNNCDVDTDDLLPIGLQFGNTGPARPVVFDFAWQAQAFIPWATDPTDPAFTDAFADATGDGRVSEIDMLPIGVNFGNTHDAATGCDPGTGKRGTATSKGRVAQVQAVPVPKRVSPGEVLTIELQVGPGGGDVSDFFGLSLKLGYDGTILSLGEAALGLFIDDGTLVLQLDELLTRTAGEAPYAVVRTKPSSGVSGSGTVATITAEVDDEAPKGKYDIVLTDVVAINSLGEVIELAVKTSKVQVKKSTARNVPAAGGGGANTPVTFDEEEVEVTFTELGDDISVTAARYDEAEVAEELPPMVEPATDTIWELTVEGTDDFTADVCLPLRGVELEDNSDVVLLDILKRTDERSAWEDQHVELRPTAEAPTQICAVQVTGFSQFVIVAPTGTTVSVEEAAGEGAGTVPTEYGMLAHYPNPFNATTTLVYELASTDVVRLGVYDVLGREVSQLVDGRVVAGRHEVRFDARGLPSGMYLARLEVGGQVYTRTLLRVK